MIKHLCTLVWNRKRSVALTISEIFISFLAVFFTSAIGLHFLEAYRLPLGFSYENLWPIQIGRQSSNIWSEEEGQTSERLLREIAAFDQIEAAALSAASPFDDARIYSRFEVDGVLVEPELWEVSDRFIEVLGIQVTEGRWFEESDHVLKYRPVVINEQLRRERFGSEEAVGRTIGVSRSGSEVRVVGVVSDFRHRGDFYRPEGFAFEFSEVDRPFMPMTTMLVKVRHGTGIDFEEALVGRMQEVAKGWSFEVRTLSSMRRSYLRRMLAPLLLGAMVAGFFLLMVSLGLVGVLWQSVTQRTRELGLRRAKGATRNRIHRQILGEVFVTSTLAMGAAALVILHFGLFDLLAFASIRACSAAFFLSAALIYLLSSLCALYPAWLATRIQPAQALHYE
jgi:putative ABC transport system permease protein